MKKFGSGEIITEDYFIGARNHSHFKRPMNKFLKEEIKKNGDMKLRHFKPRSLDEYAKKKFDEPLPAMAFIYGNVTNANDDSYKIMFNEEATTWSSTNSVTLKFANGNSTGSGNSTTESSVTSTTEEPNARNETTTTAVASEKKREKVEYVVVRSHSKKFNLRGS